MGSLGVVPVEPEGDRLHRGRRARHRDEGPGPPHGEGAPDLVEHDLDRRRHRLQLGRARRVAGHEPLGEPDAPEPRRDGGEGLAVAEHELRRAPADVQHEVRRWRQGGVQPRGRAEERQGRLPLTGEDLELRPRVLADRGRVPLPVRCVAHRARRRHADPLRVEGPGPTAVPGEHLDRPPQRLGVEPPGLVDPVPEPGDDHVAGELAEAPRGIRLGDEEPDGVRALVDGRDPTRALLVDRLHALGDPGTDGVGAARQVVGVVGVQALDADTGPSNAAEVPRRRSAPRALERVRLVGGGERAGEALVPLGAGVQLRDGAPGLQARDGPDRFGTREPEERGERSALGVQRSVPDHEGVPRRAARHHGERGGRLPPELLADGLEIAPSELSHGEEATCACARRRGGDPPGAPRSGA
ncbi:hypothetical protein HRbin12_01842 [bacterium HR12]|nr:hypothetical protein HRbin12_01842 [bacterium HR12]